MTVESSSCQEQWVYPGSTIKAAELQLVPSHCSVAGASVGDSRLVCLEPSCSGGFCPSPAEVQEFLV